MSTEYRHNHYVPEWYQKRFLPLGQKNQELYYLNSKPGVVVDPRGVPHPKRPVRFQGFKYCFAERDLYTTKMRGVESTDIEKYFFGEIDRKGRDAVEYFTHFDHSSVNGDAFKNIVVYMSTQKLRTPKGLAWLAQQVKSDDRQRILSAMIKLRQLHCATWTECVWQIADASESATKFIISDHPVTVYNRRCGPRSQWCREFNDPEIWMNATHSIFPLSLEKVLILTNLSWVRNPYQKETNFRPNPKPLRDALFNFHEIQILRYLSETEVRQINFIIKSRALRYIAAAKEEWLAPDDFVSKSDWHEYGQGYLFMPDPRPIHMGGTIMWGGGPSRGGMMDEYGRFPWQKDFEKESRTQTEARTLERFQGEFARLFGPKRRGRSFLFDRLDDEIDDKDFHQHHLQQENNKRQPKKH